MNDAPCEKLQKCAFLFSNRQKHVILYPKILRGGAQIEVIL